MPTVQHFRLFEAEGGTLSRQTAWVFGLALALGCSGGPWNDEEPDPYDLTFDIPRTENFAPNLSATGLYDEPLADLQPTDGLLPYELSSELFTDYASKQRLMAVPAGQSVGVQTDGTLVFPEGTVLVKTFFFPTDRSNMDGERRIIETRLLVKTDGVWNAATYLWNDAQTDAELLLQGTTLDVSWTDADGTPSGTAYTVPHEGECMTCHQLAGESRFIGPTLRNLNRSVVRDGQSQDQLQFLSAAGVFVDWEWSAAPTIPNYRDVQQPIERRARAYLDINCAHCHNPDGWGESSQREIDFRYDTPYDQTGLQRQSDELVRLLRDGEMPYLGTTMVHQEGVALIEAYVDSL